MLERLKQLSVSSLINIKDYIDHLEIENRISHKRGLYLHYVQICQKATDDWEVTLLKCKMRKQLKER